MITGELRGGDAEKGDDEMNVNFLRGGSEGITPSPSEVGQTLISVHDCPTLESGTVLCLNHLC